MDLRAYLTALRKNWWLILTTLVVGGVVGLGAYFVVPPTYANSVVFFISTPLNDNGNAQAGGQFAQNRITSYVQVLESESLAERVASATGLPKSEVFGEITATGEASTVLVTATVVDASPSNAARIAGAMATAFPDLVDDLDNTGKQSDVVKVNRISGPTPSNGPVNPKLDIYLGAGLAAGLVLGVLVALLRELLDSSVRSTESARTLVGAPVIGSINNDPAVKRQPLVLQGSATSARAEAYRQLRTNLRFVDAAQDTNVLLITSSLPYEGKSLTAANLALAFVEAGQKTLLIDADLRRPSQSDLFGMNRDLGLTNVLIGKITAREAIRPWGEDGLYFLSSGQIPPNPSELLGSTRMGDLMAELRTEYDKIIIDSPPLVPVADAAVASALVDGVLMIVRHGKTARHVVAAAAASLHNVHAPLIGVAFSMRRPRRADRKLYESAYATQFGPEMSREAALTGTDDATHQRPVPAGRPQES